MKSVAAPVHRAPGARLRFRVALLLTLLASAGVMAAESRGVEAPVGVLPAVLEEVVRGSPMHGIEGITVGPDGALYVACITARRLYRVDPRDGEVRTFVGAPQGGADDLTFAPDGTAVWTGGAAMNALMARSPRGQVRAIVTSTPGLNAVRFAPNGRLFFTRIFAGDGLYEADPSGARPVRTLAEHIGGLNAFDFAADGAIVGPLFFRGTVDRFDPDTGAAEVIADGFESPSAVRVLPDGYLVLNYRSGEIWRLDSSARSRSLLVRVDPPADNFILKDGRRLYVTSTAWNGITEVELASGRARRITWGALTAPGMLSAARLDGRDVLLIADDSALKAYDIVSGNVRIVALGATSMGIRGIASLGDRFAVLNAYQPGVISLVDPGNGATLARLTGFGRPSGMTRIPSGLLVADYAKGELVEVRTIDPTGRRTLASQLGGPMGVAVAPDGRIYVSEYDAGRISVLRPQGEAANGYRVEPALAGLQHPTALALAADGRLLILETGRRQLLAFDPASGSAAVIARHLAVGLSDGNDPGHPFLLPGMVVTADGAAYLPGDVDNVLYRVSFGGARP